MTLPYLQPKNWKEKIAQMMWGVKVGERAESLRQAKQRFKNVESLTYETRDYLMGNRKVDKQFRAGEEEMHIGDDNRTYHQYPKPAIALGKMLLGAGLIASGIGIPTGAWFIANGLKEMKPNVINKTEIVKPVGKVDDTDSVLELTLPGSK